MPPVATAGGPVLRLLKPHPAQREVLDDDHRFKTVAAGRRAGKSTCADEALLVGHGPKEAQGVPKFIGALHGGQLWWVVPTLPTSGWARWRELKRAAYGCWTSKDERTRRLEFPGGGSIEIRTADDPDALRGEGLDGVVLDETPLMAEETWTEALRPALADRQGWAMFLSTPKGRANWFFKLYTYGAEPAELARLKVDAGVTRPGWRSWRFHSRVNPIMTEEEITNLRLDLGALRFAQEVEADFVVAGGTVFKRLWFRYYDVTDNGQTIVLEADTPRRVNVRGLSRWATVDLAVSTKTTADRTVIATQATAPGGEVMLLDLVAGRMEAPDITPALKAAWRKHRHSFQGVEATAFQLSIVQSARRAGLPVRPIRAEGDKVSRALTLAAKMEGGMFYLPRSASWLDEVEAELEAFTGLQAEHDDIVDALAYGAIEAAAADDRQVFSE